MNEALAQSGPAHLRIIRPKADAFVVARDSNDAAISEHFGHAQIFDQIVIVKFAFLGGTNVERIGDRMIRDFLSLVNNRCADVESGRGQCARQKRSLGKKGGHGGQANEKNKDEKNSHTNQLSSMTHADGFGANLNPRYERTTW